MCKNVGFTNMIVCELGVYFKICNIRVVVRLILFVENKMLCFIVKNRFILYCKNVLPVLGSCCKAYHQ